MKTEKIKIDKKEYAPSYGMDLMEWLGKHYDTDDIREIIDNFKDVEIGKFKFKDIPIYALVLRGAVFCGSGKDIGQKNAEDFVYMNPLTAGRVFTNFGSSLPGNGESDREILGNLKAPQKEGAELA